MPANAPSAPAAPAKPVAAPKPAPAPKPAAATPAPAAQPKPAPKAAPKPAAPERPAIQPKHEVDGDWLNTVGKELEDLDATGKVTRPAPKPKAKPKAEVPDAPDAPDAPAEEETQTEIQPPDAPDAPETPAPEVPEEADLKTNAGLRKAFDRAQLKIKNELEPELTKARTRIKELESREPEEVTPLREKLTAIEKRNQELENEIEYVNYSSSKEFQEKYAQPYLNAWNRALNDVQQLTVETENGETRQATEEDLLYISRLKLGEAITQADAMFGRGTPTILRHRELIRELAEAQDNALRTAKDKGGERLKAQQAQSQQQTEKMRKMWTQTNQALAEKYKTWFAPEEGDQEGNALLDKGRKLADRMFSPTEETRPKRSEEAVRLHALIYNKAANHDRLALRLKKASARVAELEESLKQYEESEPHGGRPGAGGRPSSATSAANEYESEIDALSAKGPRR